MTVCYAEGCTVTHVANNAANMLYSGGGGCCRMLDAASGNQQICSSLSGTPATLDNQMIYSQLILPEGGYQELGDPRLRARQHTIDLTPLTFKRFEPRTINNDTCAHLLQVGFLADPLPSIVGAITRSYCESLVRKATFECFTSELEGGIDFLLRTSSYVFFVELVLTPMLLLCTYFKRRCHDSLCFDDEETLC